MGDSPRNCSGEMYAGVPSTNSGVSSERPSPASSASPKSTSLTCSWLFSVLTTSAFDGVTLRDYLACAALQGYLAAHAGDEIELPARSEAATWAYKQADEMIKARSAN